MAVHFTENKGNANLAAIKTPFLIEDILDRNSIKAAAGNKINFKMHPDNVANQSARNNNNGGGGGEHLVNNQNDKNQRNNNEMPANDDEYRKLLQNERYD